MIISLYAGLLGLIYLMMSAYVIKGRFKNKVSLGDGGNNDMQKRVRVHGNFAEYVPFALVLLFLMEYNGASNLSIHVLGIILIVARLLHPIGLITKEGASNWRAGGTILTFLVLLISALYNIYVTVAF